VNTVRLRLTVAGETGALRKLGKLLGFPRPLPLVRFADKPLRGFPAPLHVDEPEDGS
jgi:hypothetical protein